jgi:LPS sulfotransferase NodH
LYEEKIFMLLGQARCGSTLLMNLISQLTQAHCYGELFQKECGYNSRFDLRSYLAGVTGTRPERRIGFKMLIDHLIFEDYPLSYRQCDLQEALPYQIPLINLERRNMVKTALSLAIATRDDAWLHTKKIARDMLLMEPVYIHPEQIDYMKDKLKAQLEFRDRFTNVLNLHYERDLEHPQAHQHTANIVADFLDVPHADVTQAELPAKTPMLKDWRQMIENFKELESHWIGDDVIGPMLRED